MTYASRDLERSSTLAQGRVPKQLRLNISTTVQTAAMGQILRFTEVAERILVLGYHIMQLSICIKMSKQPHCKPIIMTVMMMPSGSLIKRFDLHLSELQRVMVAFPLNPVYTVGIRGVIASQVKTVEIGLMTPTVPPATFVRHSTWVWCPVVVLVSSAEHLSAMDWQWITFTTHIHFIKNIANTLYKMPCYRRQNRAMPL